MNWTSEPVRQLLEQFLAFCSTTDGYTMRNIYTSTEDRRDLIEGFLASRESEPETFSLRRAHEERLAAVEREISMLRYVDGLPATTASEREPIAARIAKLTAERTQLNDEWMRLWVDSVDAR